MAERDEDGNDEWNEETQIVQLDEEDDDDEDVTESAYVIVINGSRVGSMVKVKGGMIIGRGQESDFQTEDDGISRNHCMIVDQDGGLAIKDLSSRNGTFVNNRKVETVGLKDGDKIRIGSTTILKFSYADQLDESFQQQMYNAALRDPLTQIYNRRHLEERMHSEFSYCSRHGLALSLIMVDLDSFKYVNDTHGHQAGDAVLIGLSKIITSSTRIEDLFARFGGDEFALLCRGITGPVSFSIANRIRRTMETARLVEQVPDLKVTVSCGVAGIPDDSIGTLEDLVGAADKALYQAKTLGRNRVCLYDADLAPDKSDPAAESTGETIPADED